LELTLGDSAILLFVRELLRPILNTQKEIGQSGISLIHHDEVVAWVASGEKVVTAITKIE